VQLLLGLSDDIDTAQKQCKMLNEVDRDIRAKFDRLLEMAGIRKVISPEELPGISIILQQCKNLRSYTLAATSTVPATPATGAPIDIHLREDGVKRPHYLFHDDANASSMERLHMVLDPVGRVALIENAVKALQMLHDLNNDDMVDVIPKDRAGCTFFTELFETIKNRTGWDVLGQLENVEPSGGKSAMQFTFDGIKASRLSFLNPQTIGFYRNFSGSSGFNLSSKLAYIYIAQDDFNRKIMPAYEVAKRKFATYKPSGDTQVAFEQLRHIVDDLSSRPVIGKANREALNWIFSSLEVEQPEKELTDFQVLRTSLCATTNSFVKTGLNVRRELTALSRELTIYLNQQGNLPEGFERQFSTVAVRAITAFATRGCFPDEMLPAVTEVQAALRELSVQTATSSVRKSALAVVSPESVEMKPPFFDESGKLLFWLSGTPKNSLLHWSPHCPVYQKGNNQKAVNTDTLRDEDRRYKCCTLCKTPIRPYWEDYQREWRTKYNGRVWSAPDGTGEVK
jgi:hypothetical protein